MLMFHILTVLYQFVHFLQSHQSYAALYCVCAMGLAGYLLCEARHNFAPALAYAQQPVPPINVIVSCMESNGKWSIEAKILDWSA